MLVYFPEVVPLILKGIHREFRKWKRRKRLIANVGREETRRNKKKQIQIYSESKQSKTSNKFRQDFFVSTVYVFAPSHAWFIEECYP